MPISHRCIKKVTRRRPVIIVLLVFCQLRADCLNVLSDGINYFLYENRLIYDAQYGFVKGRSIEVEDEEEEERLFGKINVHYA